MRGPFEVAAGEIFAEDGPGGIFVANVVVCADELPHGGTAPEILVIAIRILKRSEGDAPGDDRPLELIPYEMWETDPLSVFFQGVFGFLFSAGPPEAAIYRILLEGELWRGVVSW